MYMNLPLHIQFSNLLASTDINYHYKCIDITNPFFITDSSTITLELDINTPAASVFDFYGLHLIFEQNNF